jgi:hypothetical protein
MDGERIEFDERIRIDERLDAFARRALPSRVLLFVGPGTRRLKRLRALLAKRVDLALMRAALVFGQKTNP